jgi:hypothetical protein
MVAPAGAPSGDIRVLPLDEPLESLVHVGSMGNRAIPFERLRNEMAIADHPSRFRAGLVWSRRAPERGEWFNKDLQELVRRS